MRLTGETITDEQIRDYQRSISGRVFPASGMAHTELSEEYEMCRIAIERSETSPWRYARGRIAEIINGRNEVKS